MKSDQKDPGRKKLLVIANLLQASPRIPRLVKILGENGWAVTIITPAMAGGAKMASVPYEDFRRMGVKLVEVGVTSDYESRGDSSRVGRKRISARILDRLEKTPNGRLHSTFRKYYWRAYCTYHFPDREKDWRGPATRAAIEEMCREAYSAVLSSSSPVTVHYVAAELKKRTGVPWVAEYRDLWTLNHNNPLGPVMRMLEKRVERKVMKGADALVTVSEALADDLGSMFPGKAVLEIQNGYDAEAYREPVKVTDEFTITYTGQFYHGKQNPFLLFDAVRDLIQEGRLDRSVRFRLFGRHDDLLEQYAMANGLEDVITQHGMVGRDESLRRQRESQILFYPDWEDRAQTGISSLKVMEYLASGRPILMTGGFQGAMTSKIVEETNTGRVARSLEEVKSILVIYFKEYSAQGIVSYHGLQEEISKYDFKVISKRYLALLKEKA